MNFKELSPAYLTSLAALLLGALFIALPATWLTGLGWLLVILGLGLNLFSTLVMLQRYSGGPLTDLFAEEEAQPAAGQLEAEGQEPEPVTEAQELVDAAEQKQEDERIFRGPVSRPGRK